MLSIAFAFAPVAAVSLFAASVPVLTGLRQRHARPAERTRVSGNALEITATPSAFDESLAIAARNATDGVHALSLSVSVYSASGAECARFELPARRLLPGRTADEHLALGALEPGRYHAVVVAEFGGELFAAQYAWTHSCERPALAAAA